MKSRLTVILIFAAAALIQITFLDRAAIFSVRPSLMLILLYALAITGGEWRGLLYGCAAGIIEDCLSGGPKGLFLSGYALAGYLAGRAGKKVFNIGEAANLSGIFALSIIQGVYTVLLLNTFTVGYDAVRALWRYVLPQALYNAALGVFLLWLFKEQVARRVPWLKAIRQLQTRL